jgi:hypothetical protein
MECGQNERNFAVFPVWRLAVSQVKQQGPRKRNQRNINCENKGFEIGRGICLAGIAKLTYSMEQSPYWEAKTS